MKTIESEKSVYPENKCEISFTSDTKINEGLNLVFVVYRRYFEYGSFNVDCTIGNKRISQKNVGGMFEHVWSRN